MIAFWREKPNRRCKTWLSSSTSPAERKCSLKDLQFWPRFPTIHGSIANMHYTSKHTTEGPCTGASTHWELTWQKSFEAVSSHFVSPRGHLSLLATRRNLLSDLGGDGLFWKLRNIKLEEQGTLIYSLARKMHSGKGNKCAREPKKVKTSSENS